MYTEDNKTDDKKDNKTAGNKTDNKKDNKTDNKKDDKSETPRWTGPYIYIDRQTGGWIDGWIGKQGKCMG